MFQPACEQMHVYKVTIWIKKNNNTFLVHKRNVLVCNKKILQYCRLAAHTDNCVSFDVYDHLSDVISQKLTHKEGKFPGKNFIYTFL